jgi:hypothetical protein
MARKREPFVRASAITGVQFRQPMSAVGCLEYVIHSYILDFYVGALTITLHRYINVHIRADKQNQLRLRTAMTEEDKEIIRAAGRNEGTFPARILKEKMGREHLYANVPGPHKRTGLGIKMSVSPGRQYFIYCCLPFFLIILLLSLLPMLPLVYKV